MNRYPLWKYVTVAFALVLGFIYTLPNFFGESPAVQVSSAKATLKVDQKTQDRVEEVAQGRRDRPRRHPASMTAASRPASRTPTPS